MPVPGSDSAFLSLGHNFTPCLFKWPLYPAVSSGIHISTRITADSSWLPSILPHLCFFSCHDPPLAHALPSVKLVLQLNALSAQGPWALSAYGMVKAFRTWYCSTSKKHFTVIHFFCDTCKKLPSCVLCSALSFRREQPITDSDKKLLKERKKEELCQ